MENIKITATTTSECKDFLKIKWKDEPYQTIDEFMTAHYAATQEELDTCMINYRGIEKTYKDFINDHVSFANSLEFAMLDSWFIIPNSSINASRYFMKKATDCLQTARFFTLQSHLILYRDLFTNWKVGYAQQFMKRCIYFGTASTWYSNTFDQLLQAVYWAYELYKNAEDRDGNIFDGSWDEKKIMSLCNYEFVVSQLKAKGLMDIRKILTSCSGKIEEVRSWNNYIKHKGGIEYKYLEPKELYAFFVQKVEPNGATDNQNRFFSLENFKSPIEIDIDEKMSSLTDAHKALYCCTTNLIKEINYPSYELKFGGTQ